MGGHLRLRVLERPPRDIGNLKETELLALIEIDRSREPELHEERRARAPGARLAVLVVGRAVAQQPVGCNLVVGARRHLRKGEPGCVARDIVIGKDPCGR